MVSLSVDWLAIARGRGAAEQLQVQARCGDDDVALEMLTGIELIPVLAKGSMVSVTTSALPVTDGLEQIAVGRQAESLFPWVVARPEVLLDVVAFGQPPLGHGHQRLAHELREAPD